VKACSVEISPGIERSKSSTNDTNWMSSVCTFARRTAAQAHNGIKHTEKILYRRCAHRRDMLRCLYILSQARPTQVFLRLLFLGSDARVLSGRSLRRTVSTFIALYNAERLLVCTVRSNYSKAQAQLGFHILSQCGVLCGRLSVGRELYFQEY